MQVPKRKIGKYSQPTADPHVTKEKLEELKQELKRLKSIIRPRLIAETKRLGELGDFSENAEYQLAKGRLRGTNARIDELERLIGNAVIIEAKAGNTVGIGSRVTVESDAKEYTYTILGSSEADPSQGVISHTSPVGAALLGRRVGEEVSVRAGNRTVVYRIISVG